MSKNSANTHNAAISRRRFLESAGVAGLTTVIASLALIAPAHAKVAQTAVMYQDTPKSGRNCAGCKFFQAGTKSCQRVAGEISPDGWCAIWRKK